MQETQTNKQLQKVMLMIPESQFSGLSGSGWAIRAIIALQTDWSVQAGLQAFFKISRQISPV